MFAFLEVSSLLFFDVQVFIKWGQAISVLEDRRVTDPQAAPHAIQLLFFDSVKIAALALVCTSHGEQPGHTSFSPDLMCNQITRQQLLRESQNRGGAPQGFANLSHPFLT